MNNIKYKEPFELIDLISTKEKHTISKSIHKTKDSAITLFSLGENTEISEEIYNMTSIYYILDGNINIANNYLEKNNLFLIDRDNIFDIKANKISYLLEIKFKGGWILNNIEKGKTLILKEMIAYEDGGISNLDIANNEGLKFMLLAFDEKEALLPHAAPGDALIFALEGRAKITIGDKETIIEEGEQLVFPKGEMHSVEALTKYKMAILLEKK